MHRTIKCAVALGLLLLSSCGGRVADPLRCDGGKKLVFGWQPLRYPSDVGAGLTLNVENGSSFLFIDGACHYWAYSYNGQPYGYWNDFVTGTLTEEQLAGVNRDLIQRDWESIAATPVNRSTFDHPAPTFAWQGEHVGECLVPCDDHPMAQVNAKSQEWIERFYQTGASLPASTPMRWVASDGAPPEPGEDRFVPWLGSSLAAVGGVGSPYDGSLVYGGYDLVPTADLAEIRAQREANRQGSGWLSMFLLQGGIGYLVNARQVLPFEDENGLVRPPGFWGGGGAGGADGAN